MFGIQVSVLCNQRWPMNSNSPAKYRYRFLFFKSKPVVIFLCSWLTTNVCQITVFVCECVLKSPHEDSQPCNVCCLWYHLQALCQIVGRLSLLRYTVENLKVKLTQLIYHAYCVCREERFAKWLQITNISQFQKKGKCVQSNQC